MGEALLKTKVLGIGSYLPERVLTNADLARTVDTSDEWIVTRTGIRTRHIAAENEAASDMGDAAAERALSYAEVNAEDVDMIIAATLTPDMPFPNTACLIQEKIGAKGAWCFPGDVSERQVGKPVV